MDPRPPRARRLDRPGNARERLRSMPARLVAAVAAPLWMVAARLTPPVGPRLLPLWMLAALLACGPSRADDDGEGQAAEARPAVRVSGDTVIPSPSSRELIGLRVEVPPHHAFGDWIETTGQIVADPGSLAAVSAPAEGRIDGIAAEPGDLVSRGQPLVRFSSPEYLSGSTTLRAPRPGWITARLAEVGQVVQPGTPVLEIADLRQVLLLVDVFPEMVPRVERGMRVEAVLPGDSVPRAGSIDALGVEVDPGSQATHARVQLPNPDGALRPGTFVRVRIQTRPGGEAVFTPAPAVIRDSLGQWVYVPAGEGFVPRRVEAHPVPGDSMAIVTGVEPGQAVVLEGAYQLHQAGFTFKGLVTFGEEAEEEEEEEK